MSSPGERYHHGEALPREGGGRNEANTHRTIEGESIMRVCLSQFSIARQNGPLKMEINIRRRLISIANHKPPLYSLYRLPHPPSSFRVFLPHSLVIALVLEYFPSSLWIHSYTFLNTYMNWYRLTQNVFSTFSCKFP